MSSVNETFQNIRFLKFYGWGKRTFIRYPTATDTTSTYAEDHWSQKVLGLRDRELRWRIAGNALSATSAFIWYATWLRVGS